MPKRRPSPTSTAAADQHGAVDRVGERADLDVAEQAVGLGDEVGLHAPDQLDDVLDDEEEGVGDEDQHHLVAAVAEAQQAALDERAHHQADQQRRQDQHGVAAHGRVAGAQPGAGERGRGVGAQRVQAAVRHVEDAHHAVDRW